MLSKLAKLIKSRQYELFLGSCIVLISIISYNLGQINSLKKEPISVKENRMWNVESSSQKAEIFEAVQPKITNQKILDTKYKILDTRVVASKNSNKYHRTWCAGAKKIKAENQIWFNSAQEAESMGYTLAGNCN